MTVRAAPASFTRLAFQHTSCLTRLSGESKSARAQEGCDELYCGGCSTPTPPNDILNVRAISSQNSLQSHILKNRQGAAARTTAVTDLIGYLVEGGRRDVKL
jgi:hypothetical protein